MTEAWKLVPVEPTREMQMAERIIAGSWKTMLAAAPAPDDAVVERVALAIRHVVDTWSLPHEANPKTDYWQEQARAAINTPPKSSVHPIRV